MKRRVVLLLSGGLDSATLLARSVKEGDVVFPLAVDYGQRNLAELDRARSLAQHYGCELTVATLRGSIFRGGLASDEVSHGHNVVPGRNLVLLALAAAHAMGIGAEEVQIGCNRDDAQDYPDCTPDFLEGVWIALRNSSNLSLSAPLTHLTKIQVVQWARELGVPMEKTLSCYNPSEAGESCGRCAACRLRAEALQ